MNNNYKNANMWQKSAIQRIIEKNTIIDNFKNTLSNLMENYNIVGNVFGFPNGEPAEINKGYFNVYIEKSDLQEAIRELTEENQYIRIIDNKVFQVGSVHNNFTNCDNTRKIVDIETQSYIQ